MEVEALGMEWEEIQFLNQFFVLKAMAFSYMKSFILLSSSEVQTPSISKFLTTARESEARWLKMTSSLGFVI